MVIELNVFHISKQMLEDEDVYEVNMIECFVLNTFIQTSFEDHLDAFLNHFGYNFDIKKSIKDVNSLLELVPSLSTTKWQQKVFPLPLFSIPPLPFDVEPPNLD